MTNICGAGPPDPVSQDLLPALNPLKIYLIGFDLSLGLV